MVNNRLCCVDLLTKRRSPGQNRGLLCEFEHSSVLNPHTRPPYWPGLPSSASKSTQQPPVLTREYIEELVLDWGVCRGGGSRLGELIEEAALD